VYGLTPPIDGSTLMLVNPVTLPPAPKLGSFGTQSWGVGRSVNPPAGRPAVGPRERRDKAAADGIGNLGKHDRERARFLEERSHSGCG
jgi:hypothetical protein